MRPVWTHRLRGDLDALPWLGSGWVNGIPEHVDQMTPDLRAHPGQHSVQPFCGVRASVSDDLRGGSGEGQFDSSAIVRVGRAAHHPGVRQPINHGGRRRWSCAQYVGEIGEADRRQCADQVHRGELQQRHTPARPHGWGAGRDDTPQVRQEPVDILGLHRLRGRAPARAPTVRPGLGMPFVTHGAPSPFLPRL
jgi:hypothetical protein